MRYWRVTFKKDGSLNQIREIKSPGHSRWIVVEAENQEAAQKAAMNLYCARKRKQVRARNYTEGKCICGRKQDRTNPDGTFMKTCSVCSERQKIWQSDWNQRQKQGITEPKQRDEAARVEACKERVRDRKNEMRIEVLMEVRNAWQASPTIGQFSKWLKEEIEKCTSSQHSSIDGKKQ